MLFEKHDFEVLFGICVINLNANRLRHCSCIIVEDFTMGTWHDDYHREVNREWQTNAFHTLSSACFELFDQCF